MRVVRNSSVCFTLDVKSEIGSLVLYRRLDETGKRNNRDLSFTTDNGGFGLRSPVQKIMVVGATFMAVLLRV